MFGSPLDPAEEPSDDQLSNRTRSEYQIFEWHIHNGDLISGLIEYGFCKFAQSQIWNIDGLNT